MDGWVRDLQLGVRAALGREGGKAGGEPRKVGLRTELKIFEEVAGKELELPGKRLAGKKRGDYFIVILH